MKQPMRALLLGTALVLGAAALCAHAADAPTDKPALSGPPAGAFAAGGLLAFAAGDQRQHCQDTHEALRGGPHDLLPVAGLP